MTADTTPSLVERLTNPIAQDFETTVQMLTRWRAERQEAASYITELEGERDRQEQAHLTDIDLRDAYEKAIQSLDLRAGGDGEFRGSSDPARRSDPISMARAIGDRFEAAEANARRLEALLRALVDASPALIVKAIREASDADDPSLQPWTQAVTAARAALTTKEADRGPE